MKEFFAKLNFWKLAAVFFGIWLLLMFFFWGRVNVHAETLDDSYFIYINPSDANYYKCHGSYGANNYSPEDSSFEAYFVKPYSSNTWSPVNGMTFSNSSVVKDYIVSGEFFVPDSWNSKKNNSVYVPDNWALNTIAIPYPSNYWNYDYHLIYMSGSNMICALSTKPIYVKNKDDSTIYQSYVPLPQTDQFIYMLQWNGSNWSDLGTVTFNDTSISDLHGIDTLYAGYINFGNFVYNTVLGIDIYTDNYAIIESEGSLPTFDILASEFESSSDIEVDPEPTPTPEPELAFSFFVKGKSFWSNSLLTGDGYYMVDVYASDIYSSLDVPLSSSNAALSAAVSTYSVSSPWVRPAVVRGVRDSYYGDFCYAFYFAGTLSSVKFYYIGSVLPTHSKGVIRNSYTAIDIPLDTNVTSTVYAGTSSGLNVLGFFFEGKSYDLIDLDLLEYGFYDMGSTYFNGHSDVLFNYSSSSLTNPLVQGYHVGLTNSPIEGITPTPTPTPEGWEPTPSPSPTPTPPTVIIQWPTSTPTPTPPAVIDINIPTMPLGDLPSALTENYLDDTIRIVNYNGQFGLLAKAFSFIPNELQYLIWLLIFILLILAVIKMIIHFGG